jgi:hypothetical protein
MRISEIEVVNALGIPSDTTLQNFAQGAQLVSNANQFNIYQTIFGNQEVYFTGQPLPISYIVLQNHGNKWWYLEGWTDPNHRRQNLQQTLVMYAISIKGQIYVDVQMTIASIRMIEKMINSGLINAAVYDSSTNTLTGYNPNNPQHQNKALYDMPAPGVNRPVLPNNIPGNMFRWVLSEGWPNRPVRHGILNPYIIENVILESPSKK